MTTAEAAPAKKSSPKPGLSPFCNNIIGKSSSICKVFSLIEKVQDTDSTVLIQGESGTGKELIARALHFGGDRGNKPFVPVNCGAIPAELLESELFGHEKGAFTHAIRTRIGRFEMADGGTVFLDEIAEMSPVLQVKLLRVLQEKSFERVGGAKTISSDFRVIAATNRDLAEEVRNGNFREDLYYRLTVIPIESPPLRDRKSDIPLLLEAFLKRFCVTKKRVITGVDDDALECLKRYQWPGNVRELENMVERMVILAAGEVITMEDLPPQLLNTPAPANSPTIAEIPETDFCLSEIVADYERKLIVRALQQTGWVKNRAAKLLKVNRTTLLEKMKRHGVDKSVGN
ncbi:MAG: sigma-54 dependent transcriptional regulator [Proteobacteria bacterium]|nr:sigma-54 dependent transcriptional regulator [Pseudomonadota bacterium]MBU1639961.1 sigma-54 dependent transcriptional regulator [Pseudomonadota bacterium]